MTAKKITERRAAQRPVSSSTTRGLRNGSLARSDLFYILKGDSSVLYKY